MTRHGFGGRLEQGLLLYSSAHGRTSLERWGQLLAEKEGRDRPYAKGAVGDWFSERNEPTLAIFEATAALVGGDPEWFAFGKGNPPPNPLVARTKASPKSGKQRKQKEG